MEDLCRENAASGAVMGLNQFDLAVSVNINFNTNLYVYKKL